MDVTLRKKTLDFEIELIEVAVSRMTVKFQIHRELGDNPRLHDALNRIAEARDDLLRHERDLSRPTSDR